VISRPEKKKKKEHHARFDPSAHVVVAGLCKLAVYCRGSFIHPAVIFVTETEIFVIFVTETEIFVIVRFVL